MANGGFFAQKSASPTRFALVAAGHAVVLAAVLLAAGPQITRHWEPPIKVTPIPVPPTPDPVEPPHSADPPLPLPPRPTAPEPQVDLPPRPDPGPLTDGAPTGPVGGGTVTSDPAPPADPPAPPVRRGAEVDPRFAHLLQPQYPMGEQRAGRGGTVVIRVTIGPDGRVRSAERVSATSDAFWAAAERQALSRWRFRPATIDGRPVESSRTMTVYFRIEDV